MDPSHHCDLRKTKRKLRDCMSVCKQAICKIALSPVLVQSLIYLQIFKQLECPKSLFLPPYFRFKNLSQDSSLFTRVNIREGVGIVVVL